MAKVGQGAGATLMSRIGSFFRRAFDILAAMERSPEEYLMERLNAFEARLARIEEADAAARGDEAQQNH